MAAVGSFLRHDHHHTYSAPPRVDLGFLPRRTDATRTIEETDGLIIQATTRSHPSPQSLKRCRVLVADDHAVVRAGYRHFLSGHPSILTVGEAQSGNETLEKLREAHWDILLLDIAMPDRSGLDILARVRAIHPDVRVLIISGLPESLYAESVLRAGAVGYLPKELAAPELLRAINLVLQGRKYVSTTYAEHLAANLQAPRTTLPHQKLKSKEFQIFLKLASGRRVSEIASELRLSSKTVGTYRTKIFRELDCSSLSEVTRYALENHLIQ